MPISNNKPRDHHYVPVFYLKQWCGPNNKLIEFTVKHGNFIAKPVGPKGTVFQTDLYAFPELPSDKSTGRESTPYFRSCPLQAGRKLLQGGLSSTPAGAVLLMAGSAWRQCQAAPRVLASN